MKVRADLALSEIGGPRQPDAIDVQMHYSNSRDGLACHRGCPVCRKLIQQERRTAGSTSPLPPWATYETEDDK